MFSDNELKLFNQIFTEFGLRIDGRKNLEIRGHSFTPNVIPNCAASLKLQYNNNQNSIIFAVKSEIVVNENNSIENNNLIVLDINTMQNSKNNQIASYLINILNKLLINNINTETLYIENSNKKLYWKLYLDVCIYDDLRLSLLQLISLGINKVFENLHLPKIVYFMNQITKEEDYDLLSKYNDSLKKDNYEMKINLKLPNIYVFSVLGNNLIIDPEDEELAIGRCTIFISAMNHEIINIEGVGDEVDPILYVQLHDFIKNL
jgi:exosome complex RNA-binding protein Rrp42 (RNase PH superfamily)